MGIVFVLLFAWIVFSFVVNLMRDFFIAGDSQFVPRTISMAAFGLHLVLPFAVGIVCLRTQRRFVGFLDGFVLAAFIAAVVHLVWYVYVYFNDPSQLRYVMGQRIPLIFGLAAIIFIFRYRLTAPRYFSIVALLFFAVFVSQTRALNIMIFVILPVLLSAMYLMRRDRLIACVAAIGLASILATYVGGAFHRVTWLAQPSQVSRESFRNLAAKGLDSSEAVLVDEATKSVNKPSPSAPPQSIEDSYLGYLEEKGFRASAALYAAGVRDESLLIRFIIWDSLIKKIGRDGWTMAMGFGQLGPGYVGDAFISPHGAYVSRYSAHNEYVDIITRSGLVGLAAFLLAYSVLIYAILRELGTSSEGSPIGAALAIVLLMASGYGVFHETVRYPPFGMLVGAIAGGTASLTSKRRFPVSA